MLWKLFIYPFSSHYSEQKKQAEKDGENTIRYNKTSSTSSGVIFLIKRAECVTQRCLWSLWSRTNPRSYLFWRHNCTVLCCAVLCCASPVRRNSKYHFKSPPSSEPEITEIPGQVELSKPTNWTCQSSISISGFNQTKHWFWRRLD